MPITLTNRASHLLIIELNDGESIYLAPGRTSNSIDEGQVNGNGKLSKLMRNNLLSADAVKAEESQAAAKSSPQSSAPESQTDTSTAPVETEGTAGAAEPASATGKSRGR